MIAGRVSLAVLTAATSAVRWNSRSARSSPVGAGRTQDAKGSRVTAAGPKEGAAARPETSDRPPNSASAMPTRMTGSGLAGLRPALPRRPWHNARVRSPGILGLFDKVLLFGGAPRRRRPRQAGVGAFANIPNRITAIALGQQATHRVVAVRPSPSRALAHRSKGTSPLCGMAYHRRRQRVAPSSWNAPALDEGQWRDQHSPDVRFAGISAGARVPPWTMLSNSLAERPSCEAGRMPASDQVAL